MICDILNMQRCSVFSWSWQGQRTHKLGLELELDLGPPTLHQLQFAPMATTGTRRTHARLTATTALIILSEEYLLAQVRGFMASTDAAIMEDGVATTVADGTETMTDSAIGGNSAANADGMAIEGSTGTRASTAVSFVAGATFMVGKIGASMMEVDFMGAGSTAGAADSSDNIPHSPSLNERLAALAASRFRLSFYPRTI